MLRHAQLLLSRHDRDADASLATILRHYVAFDDANIAIFFIFAAIAAATIPGHVC